MSDGLKHRAVATVRNPKGLHLRPLELISRKARDFESQIQVSRGDNRVDAKSLLHLLTLGAQAGMELEVEACGEDASGAVAELVRLIEMSFEGME